MATTQVSRGESGPVAQATYEPMLLNLTDRGYFANMNVGKQVAEFLPFLRRFARALTGSQSRGDAFVTATLERLLDDRKMLADAKSVRVALYREFIISLNIFEDPHQVGDEEENSLAARASNRLSAVSLPGRAALLLSTVEDFTNSEVAEILGVEAQVVDKLVASAVEAIDQDHHANILIIEDEPLIAMQLSEISRSLGHTVLGPFSKAEDAIAIARSSSPDLILADIQILGAKSGLTAVHEIYSFAKPPVIFITAYPERLLSTDRPEPTYLITKPFVEDTVRAAISQALFFGTTEPMPETLAEPDGPSEVVPSTARPQRNATTEILSNLSRHDLSAKLAPLDVEVDEARLVIRHHGPPETLSALEGIEALRTLHLESATRILNSVVGTNLGIQLEIRLKAIFDGLVRPFDDMSGLLLGVQAKGLRDILPSIRNEAGELLFADLEAFLADISNLSWQFPSYRNFLMHSPDVQLTSPEGREAIVQASRVFEGLDSAVIEDAAKDIIVASRVNFEVNPTALSEHGLIRTLGNAFRALARYALARLKGAAGSANKAFDEMSGKFVALIAVSLGVVFPSLFVLSRLLPSDFGFVIDLLKVVKMVAP